MKFILPVFTNEPPQEEEVISLKGENYFNLVKRVERVERVETEVKRLESEIDRLEAENAKLREENAELKRCLSLNSTNSSKPPSSDPPSLKYPPRTSPGRRAGKQEEAKGHRRLFLEPTEIIDHRPKLCRHCGIDIPPDLPVSGSYQRRQQVEIPPIKPVVTEHHYHSIRYPKCGKLIREEVNEEHKPC
jgi:transposase